MVRVTTSAFLVTLLTAEMLLYNPTAAQQNYGFRGRGIMKRFVIGTIVQRFLVMSLLVSAVSAEEAILPWAYPVNPPGTKPPVDDGSLRHVPGSALAFTLSQVNDRYSTADWHPGDHPQLPEIIAHGRRPEVYACGWCHRASGVGGPENANLTGLPAA